VNTVISADWVLPIEGTPIERGAVAIEGGRIAAVGTAEELGSSTHYADAAILPAFVNAHSHIEYAVYAGFGDSLLDFAEWIRLHTERKRRIGWDEYVAIARLGAAECLRSGVGTIGDCSFSGAAAVAMDELGLRGVAYLEVFGADPDEAMEQFEELRELGLPLATHISESESEVRYLLDGGGAWETITWLVESPGTTGTRLLAREGLLGPHVLAAHCVVVEPDEISLLAEHDVAVAHCPRSNAYVGSGIAPLREFREAGLRVGVGTDGVSSTPSQDYFDELRAVVTMARARERRPDAMTATQALELSTLGGARALGLDGAIGSLGPGKRADLAVVSLVDSPYWPVEDPAGAIVFGGSPDRVLATFVDGEARYEKGEMEWHELTAAAHSARRAMLAVPPAVEPVAAPRA
jgi:cytosine/adenosine deaminase-related metal-dependent hydrolase